MTFDDIIKNKPLHLQNIATSLRQVIRSIDAQLEEHVYGTDKVKILLFHLWDKNNVLYGLQASDKYCTLYFHHLEDADTWGLKLEPSGKNTKSLKIFNQMDIKLDKLIPLMKKIHLQAQTAHQQEAWETQPVIKKPSNAVKKITIENPKSIMRKKKTPV